MTSSDLCRGFRYPAEIISHVVWLYFRFSLSFRDIKELMARCRIFVTYETIRQWRLKFGQPYANTLRRCQPRRGDKWHLDEVVLTIKGKHHYLWRAVDQEGNTLDVLRERQMRRYKSLGQAQRFLSAHAQINNPFRCRRKHILAQQYYCVRERTFMLWSDVTQAGYFQ